VLGESGVEAVRIEPLAKLMHVTKGSFYWHFRNRDELLTAILREWATRETEDIIKQIEIMGGDASTKLLNLFELAVQDDGRLENAIRIWATKSTNAVAIITEIDQRRLDYLQHLFEEIGFSAWEAKTRARLAYHSLVGEFTLGVRISQQERIAESRLHYALLVRQN
jgi:AcrR family transcriptional regulator